MFILIEENPNCGPEERVFAESGKRRPVKKVRLSTPSGAEAWCEATGIDESGNPTEALGVPVDDSGAGTALLIFGGAWGVRFRTDSEPWSLDNPRQWGLPFVLLDIGAAEVEFK